MGYYNIKPDEVLIYTKEFLNAVIVLF